jgi:hypothetical protein
MGSSDGSEIHRRVSLIQRQDVLPIFDCEDGYLGDRMLSDPLPR